MKKQVGKTKDAGWQFGLSKSFPIPQKYVWDFMFSNRGLNTWLGKLNGELEIKKEYKTRQGITGLVRVFTPYSHIRMTWKKKTWKNTSVVQVRVMGNQKKATISFHQDKLSGNSQREEMKQYWNKKMKGIEKELAEENETN